MDANVATPQNGIAVIKQEHTSATLVGVLATGGGTYGLIATPDGTYLLDTVQPVGGATTPQGVQFIDVTPVYGTNLDAEGIRRGFSQASRERKPEWRAA